MCTLHDITVLAVPVSSLSQRCRVAVILTIWQAGLFWLIPEETTGFVFREDNTRTLAPRDQGLNHPAQIHVEMLTFVVMLLGGRAFGDGIFPATCELQVSWQVASSLLLTRKLSSSTS